MMQLTKPLTNLQITLLKIYSFDIEEKQLLEIKDVLSRYFAEKATEEMDRLWEERGWTNDTMNEWLRGEEELNA